MNLNNTYVYGDIEVKLTGRYATKGRVARRQGQNSTLLEIYEITPIDKDLDWTKWVKLDELYIIKTNEDE